MGRFSSRARAMDTLTYNGQTRVLLSRVSRVLRQGPVWAGLLLLLVILHVWLGARRESLAVVLAELQGQRQQAELRQHADTAGLQLTAMQQQWHDYQQATMQFFRLAFQTNDRTVCFTRIHRYQGKIYFSGKASSTRELAAFLRRSPMLSYFGELRVAQIHQAPSDGITMELEGTERKPLMLARLGNEHNNPAN